MDELAGLLLEFPEALVVVESGESLRFRVSPKENR